MKILFCIVFMLGFVSKPILGQEKLLPVFPEQAPQREGRIVYGFVAEPKQFPHQCSLLNKYGNKNTLCGGSLISNKHVLTAAHCVYNKPISSTIACGSVDRKVKYLSMVASKYKMHEKYSPSTLNNDVAIWFLPNTVKFDAYLQAIRLPTVNQNQESAFLNSKTTVSGFGRDSVTVTASSQILRYVNVRVIRNTECAPHFATNTVNENTMCTKGFNYAEQGACFGDSGGPLIIYEAGNIPTQIGVVSFISSRGCGLNRPVGYARTSSFLKWINETTGIPLRY